MIYPLGGMLIGALLGAFNAQRKGGAVKDIVQWAVVFAIIFGLIGTFTLIFIERSYF